MNNKKETDNLTQQLLHYKTEGKPLKYLVKWKELERIWNYKDFGTL